MNEVEVRKAIADSIQIPADAITNIQPVNAGMTNISFRYTYLFRDYMIRIAGKGTELLINRTQEKEIYETIRPFDLSDRIVYFDERTGIKISEYINDAQCPDPQSLDDVKRCMKIIKGLHTKELQVSHTFDLKERIYFYESLCKEHNAITFNNYEEILRNELSLIQILEHMSLPRVLCHIDSIYANIIFTDSKDYLIDWEYAGMQDPILDVAMFAIYAYYDESKCDSLLEIYLEREPELEEWIRYYAYISLASFVWLLWTEYKQALGENYGDYASVNLEYAITYHKKVNELLGGK